MKKVTLDEVIQEQLKDEEFRMHYQKELVINAIASMVVKLRKSQKMSQQELAERAGTTQPVIARLESGVDSRMPSLELLSKIAVASHAKLNVSFELLLNNKEIKRN